MIKSISLILISLSLLHSQNIEQTIQEVLTTNPAVLERVYNYKTTKQDVTAAQSGYYPTLDIKLSGGLEQTAKTGPNGNDISLVDDGEYNVYQASLTYKQNLFNGFQTLYQVESQEYKSVSSAYSYIQKANSIAFETVNTYLQVIKNQELLITAQANVDINKQILVKVQKLFNAGLTTLSEVHKIESSLFLAKSNLVVQENTILDVSYNLQKVLGRELDPKEMIRPTLNISFPPTLEETISFSLEHNPSLLVSDYNIKLAQATQEEKKSAFYPLVDIEVSQAMNENLNGIKGTDDRFRAMAYVSYNLFNGFADDAALQKSQSKVYQQQMNKDTIKREIIENLNRAWAANNKLKEQLKYLVKYKEFSNKTLKLYSKEYDLGRRSLLDLLSAQNDFIQSKAQIIITEYSLLYAKYRILDAMGILVLSTISDTQEIYSNVDLVTDELNKGL